MENINFSNIKITTKNKEKKSCSKRKTVEKAKVDIIINSRLNNDIVYPLIQDLHPTMKNLVESTGVIKTNQNTNLLLSLCNGCMLKVIQQKYDFKRYIYTDKNSKVIFDSIVKLKNGKTIQLQ